MSESDAVSEAIADERIDSAIPNAVTSLMETLAPSVANRFGSGNFPVVAGGVSLFRAVQSYRKGDRKRALLQVVVGLFWVGVVFAQRRVRSDSSGPGLSEVAGSSTDVEEAVESGERETDHATGEEVVNTTDADIEESDTAPELDSDASEDDVDQRDVAGTDEVEPADDADETSEMEDDTGETDETGTTDESSEAGELSETDESVDESGESKSV